VPNSKTIDKPRKLRPSQKPDWQGLTLKQYCEAKRLPPAWVALHYTADLSNTLTPMERTYKGTYASKPVVEFAYMDANRKVIFTRFRESMDAGVFAEQGSFMSIPYGLWLWTNKQDKKGDWPRAVVVCEGESDQQTLTLHGIPSIGVQGVNNWKAEWANLPILKYAEKILVIHEPPKEGKPDVGKKFVASVAASFPAGKVSPLKLSAKDPSDLHINTELEKEFGSTMTFIERFVTSVRSVMVSSRKRIDSVLASDVEMELTEWLWLDHIPLQHVSVFAGMPQKGKSTAAMDVVTRLTRGKDFPGSPKQLESCEVAFMGTEDGYKQVTVPRLTAACADLKKVHLIKGTTENGTSIDFRLDNDRPVLREFLQEHPNVRLIVIDPVTSYIGEVDPNKPKEVRPFLNRLVEFVQELDVSFLLIMHLSKNPDVAALHRVGGAATWIEVPRSVWFFDVKQQEEGSTLPLSYVMVNGKLNLVADERKKSLEYTFAGVDVPILDKRTGELKDQSIGVIRWGEESNITLEQQYPGSRGAGKKRGFPAEERQKAGDWLVQRLASGPAECLMAGEDAGFNKWTLRDAKAERGIKHKRMDGRVVWYLPAENALGEPMDNEPGNGEVY
jgi:hypothetical protein